MESGYLNSNPAPFHYLSSSFNWANIFNFAEFLIWKTIFQTNGTQKCCGIAPFFWIAKASDGSLVRSGQAELTPDLCAEHLSIMVKALNLERPQPTWRAEEMVQEQLFPSAFPERRHRSALEQAGRGSNLSSFTFFRRLPGEFMTLVYQTPFWVLILERESEATLGVYRQPTFSSTGLTTSV